MYTITKTFEFCYAHRLHGYPGQCGCIHGHTAKIEIACEVKKLENNGIAIDFRELKKKMGDWIDENLDHRLILDKNDPISKVIKNAGEAVKELDVAPSAENIAKIVFAAAKSEGFPVKKVSFWESPTSIASYQE